MILMLLGYDTELTHMKKLRMDCSERVMDSSDRVVDDDCTNDGWTHN